MGVIYTAGGQQRYSVRADTSAHMRADIHAGLIAQSWNIASTLTNGYMYQIVSQQAFQAKVRLQDTGAVDFLGRHYMEAQVYSVDETKFSSIYPLYYGLPEFSGPGYELVAGVCQMFLAVFGVTAPIIPSADGYSFACGIHYVPLSVAPECADQVNPVLIVRTWWACGSRADFRSGRYCTGQYSWLVNDTLFNLTTTPTEIAATLQLYALTGTDDVNASFRVPARAVKYGNGEPLNLDALIGWDFQIRGQLYDAFQKSRDTAVDQIITTTELDAGGNPVIVTWVAWNYSVSFDLKGGGGTYYATLYLKLASVTNPVCQGYIY